MGILTKKDQREIINKLLPTSCKFPENNLIKNKCLAIHNGLKYKIAKAVLARVFEIPERFIVFFSIQ